MSGVLLSVSTCSGITLTRDRGPGDTNHTLEYIPGTAVRGALAARYLASGGQPTDDLFVRAFVQEEVSFPNLYPVQKTDQGGTIFPIPLTARSCKYWPGFLRKERGREVMHGVRDMLFHAALYQNGAKAPALLDEPPTLELCDKQDCQQSLDRIRGFAYRRSVTEYYRREARARLMARVAIDRRRRAAAEGLLYSIQAIAEDQWFCGEIRADDQALLEEICSRCLTTGKLRVGVAKTRGLGILSHKTSAASDSLCPLTERLERCDQQFKDLAEEQKCPLAETDTRYFTITLDSDCILQDSFLRCYTTIPAEEIAAALELPQGSISHLGYAAESRSVRGWNAALGIPKGDGVAITMGSAFLFAYSGPESLETLAGKLKRLEQSGLGIRRGEGFGRLTVAHPFHWEAAEKPV